VSTIGELILDNQTTLGRLATSAVVIAIAIIIYAALSLLLKWRIKDPLNRYHGRKISRYALGFITIIVVGLVWRAFAGRIGLVLGILAAGLAFALQEVIGAIAGWLNIMTGGIYRVGDRIELAGVRGDVVDITLLRTKLMEIGSPQDREGTWVQGRQPTGRIVALSNKKTFTEPVYNFSAVFEFIWEEMRIPISYRSDWREAERIIREEAEAVSRSEGAREAIRAMIQRYPVPLPEIEPRVFVRATDNWMELSARFIVPVRTARSVKDGMVRTIRDRLDEAGIEIASETIEATVRGPETGTPPPSHDEKRGVDDHGHE
jgi:small-conductance mechanosensitive channel